AGDDPLMGTWLLNTSKSKYSDGKPQQSHTQIYEPYGRNGFRFTADQVNGDGVSKHVTFTAEMDGKAYPVVGDPTRDAYSAKRIDLYTLETNNKKNGKITNTSTREISSDGKTMTVTNVAIDAHGKARTNIYVFDKK